MKTCSECKFLDLNDKDRYGDYYCTIKHKYYPLGDSTCGSFTYRENKSTSPISMGGYCYITTAVSQILGHEDNCFYLEELRKFRNQVMKKEVDCYTMLEEYKIVGPKIVEKLIQDQQKKQISEQLLQEYIIPAITSINKQHEEEAINIYISMTNSLLNYYQIESNINENYTDNLIKNARTRKDNQ